MDLGHFTNLYDVIVTGVIHVGANDGAEYSSYQALTGGPITFIEAIPEIAEKLNARMNHLRPDCCLSAVCGDKNGEKVSFNVASNNGQSSSMLELGKHADLHPDIVYLKKFETETTRLDALLEQNQTARKANVLVVDTQGADLKVLRGATGILHTIDVVLVEVSEDVLYKGGATFKEIRDFLESQGFHIRALDYNYLLYGDAIFMRKQPTSLSIYGQNLAREAALSSSSVYGIWPPERAVNGDTAQEIGFHSEEETSPWWMADFGVPRRIETVTVIDRASYEYRGESLVIEVADAELNWRTVFDRRANHTGVRRFLQAPVYEAVRAVRVRQTDTSIMNLQQIIIT
ncbi:FkbM family methyltransferase [Aquidulcibacter sp.]|uniref:FkbM family methyltransferase n=1 Tax=Aquidulcibacter sp. TaxID=2052990 RepID=UPI0025C02B78|nr:FkbM family methyltransferase [Aquidulcibacter sp.]MCA3695827.1 FkbM family methyltransferase [Aquidulcibacter sp.]